MPSAVIISFSANVETTARSMPPLIMISVIPIAPTATMTVCESTMRKLLGERNRPGVSIELKRVVKRNCEDVSDERIISKKNHRGEPRMDAERGNYTGQCNCRTDSQIDTAADY